ncbi:A-factor biosynthesis protein AfsA [Actinorhabdospora filicis]|uniref:A-factor biosynthesis protein AfsA n=1 Tax=Actinorhabdospora filicis TaxID=1785913 RepID=A0A9W6SIR5_9ACTN|nr:AfsA-related hotdog domain-containing protein [Actinorhabdospora filicis]GLZ77830.1 A-factor biosynthesis protein AfsA [Actinorhabdospora filicis]
MGAPFTPFADGARIHTLDTFLTLLECGSPPPECEARAGQGLSARDWARLESAAAGLPGVRVEPWPYRRPVALGVHKTDPANLLVDGLREIEPGEFAAGLHVDPGCGMLADRDNGARHLPGMLEVEACLQLAMAVTALRLGEAWAFVTGRTSIAFPAFLFPLPAELRLVVEDDRPAGRGFRDLVLAASIEQGERVVMTMDFRSRAFEPALIREAERRQLTSLMDVTASVLAGRR